MPIIGISLNAVNAKRNKVDVVGEVSINSTPRIMSVEEKELKQLGKKVLNIGFEFVTSYGGLGEIKIGGEMMYMHDKQKDILKHWENTKSLSPDVAVEIFNALFAKCLLKLSMIAEELQLPLPLNLPRVKPGAAPDVPATPAKEESKKEEKKEEKK